MGGEEKGGARKDLGKDSGGAQGGANGEVGLAGGR